MDKDTREILREKVKELREENIPEINERVDKLSTSLTDAAEPFLRVLCSLGESGEIGKRLQIHTIASLIETISDNYDDAYNILEKIKKNIIATEKRLQGYGEEQSGGK